MEEDKKKIENLNKEISNLNEKVKSLRRDNSNYSFYTYVLLIGFLIFIFIDNGPAITKKINNIEATVNSINQTVQAKDCHYNGNNES